MLRAFAFPTVAVALLLLTACAPAPATETPSSTSPSATAEEPVFASEEEALAAADAVIQEYWEVTDVVYQAGGQGVELLAPLVTDARMESEEVGVEIFQRGEFRQIGDHTAGGTKLQRMYESDGSTYVVVTTCVDYSNVQATNPAGEWAVRKSQADRFIHQVTLVAAGTAEWPGLRLEDSEPWPESTC